MDNHSQTVLRIALPVPLRRVFDYLPPVGIDLEELKPGIRVRVPFGKKDKAGRIGIMIGVADSCDLEADQLKTCLEIIDQQPLFSEQQLELLLWASAYYHHPIGEVLFAAIPTSLRKGVPARIPKISLWRLLPSAPESDDPKLKRATRQSQLLAFFRENPEGLTAESLRETGSGWRNIISRMIDKGWVEETQTVIPCLPQKPIMETHIPELNQHQAYAVDKVLGEKNEFRVFLLDGVTGSGKTEVYFRLIERVVSERKQVMVLIPEIGLTVQLIERFLVRFNCPLTVLHSGLNDKERLTSWLLAREGKASIVIGTRSAVWTPLPNLGLIIVDEEHDPSYKQQEGFRYSARDIAIVRAQRENIPIVLGSATPSLEALNNVQQNKYEYLSLPERAGSASQPTLRFLDLRGAEMINGLSRELMDKIRDCLDAGRQSLLFLNRRGFSPVILCHDCGWIAQCRHCDANLTYHQFAGQMRCHHCGAQQRMIPACPECGGSELVPVGQGTEQITTTLQEFFPEARILRIDRDTTSRKGEMHRMLARVHERKVDILVGTQMLSKGHHFPEVTLVGILDADNRLYGVDFRSTERLAQLIVQVAGRAGRAEHPGEVYIQTHHPDHPVLQSLARHDFTGLAKELLRERAETGLPPCSSMAIVRVEAVHSGDAMDFLKIARARINAPEQLEIWGPMVAQMERRAGRYRAMLILQSKHRQVLQRALDEWIPQVEGLKRPYNLRWSLDVDPQDTF